MRKSITLMTFGFKYGLPTTNYYFDVSFAKNPARESNWTLFDAPDDEMQDFILSQEPVTRFIDSLIPLLMVLVDLDDDIRIGIGCNAGRHRSVVIAERIADLLVEADIHVKLIHREYQG